MNIYIWQIIGHLVGTVLGAALLIWTINTGRMERIHKWLDKYAPWL